MHAPLHVLPLLALLVYSSSTGSSLLPVVLGSPSKAINIQKNATREKRLSLNQLRFHPLKGIGKSWDRKLTRLYNEADLNKDGGISFDECYQRLLFFYIELNQQAPIPPPDRATVRRLYAQSDWNHNRSLSCEEFKQLACELGEGAYARLVAHKFVTLFVAPWLAATVVHWLATAARLAAVRSRWAGAVKAATAPLLPTNVAETFVSANFWRTVVLTLTVSRLGNAVLATVNRYLYRKIATKK